MQYPPEAPKRASFFLGAPRRFLTSACLVALLSCSGGERAATTSAQSESPTRFAVGGEVQSPMAASNLLGAAPAPSEAEVPEDVTDLTSRMAPRHLHIPPTGRGQTTRFTFDGHRRGWFARSGGGALLTPIYGEGKVYVGGGFSSHALYAYDARTGKREWQASAPDGGPSAAIFEDGKVIFNTESCTLFAVDAATGRRRWSRWLGDPLMSQPAANERSVFSGHIIDGQSPGGLEPGTTGFGVGEGRRYGFTALALGNGHPRWTRAISADVMNAPVLDEATRSVLFTTMDGVVWSVAEANGQVRWRRRLNATSSPWLDGDKVHVTVRERDDGERKERSLVLAKSNGETTAEYDAVEAPFATRPDTSVPAGWAYEGSRATVVDGRTYQTIGNEVQSRNAETGELLWRRRYAEEPASPGTRPASPPAIAGSQLVFGTQSGVLFGLDIDTGLTTWAYEVGEAIVAQPTVAHGWVYASTQRGGVVALEVSDTSFDGWHQWGGNASHTGPVAGTTAPEEADERPGEGTLRIDDDSYEGQAAGFPLTGTRVRAEISGFVTRVEVEQTFTNPYDRPIDAVYLFPLPDDAAVDGMELQNGERVIRASIRRREQAREEYRDAQRRGVLASLLEQERPNLFRQSVANLKPGSTIRVTLQYTQAMPYEEGAYRFVYPLVAGPRFAEGDASSDEAGPQVAVLAPGATRPDRVEISVHAELGARVSEVGSPTHQIDVTREGARIEATLGEPARPDRDFEMRFAVAGEVPSVGLAASPPSNGEAGHFSLAVHPRLNVPDAELMPRELVFVVDASSSMAGRPMELAKAAMRRAIEGLRENDTFQVIRFSDDTQALAEESLEATAENRARGVRFVDGLHALGRTRMVEGIRAALEPATSADRLRFVVLMTDGYIAREPEVFRAVNDHLGQSRVFAFGVGSAVNRYLLTRVAEVGRGDVQVVTLDESPELAADRFHERIGRPYLTDLSIDWGGLEVADAYPRRLPDLFADRPLVVHGRYAQGGEHEIVIRGRLAGREFTQRAQVSLPSDGAARPALGSIWARARIRDLMTAMALRPSDALKEEVTQMGLRHHLLTEWTAFIAIDEESRVDQPADATVNQPQQLPAGVRGNRTTMTTSTRSGAAPSYDDFALAAEAVSPTAASAPVMRRSRRRRIPSRSLDALGGGGGGAYQRCLEQARRPDGTIDQDALQRCLQSARKSDGLRPLKETPEFRERHHSPALPSRRRALLE